MNKSILETVHNSAKGLYKIGLLNEKEMRKFDSLCLPKNSKKTVIKKTKKTFAKKVEHCRV